MAGWLCARARRFFWGSGKSFSSVGPGVCVCVRPGLDALAKEVCPCSPGWSLFCRWPGVAGTWGLRGSWPLFGGPACPPGRVGLCWSVLSVGCLALSFPAGSGGPPGHFVPGVHPRIHDGQCPVRASQPQGLSLLGLRLVPSFRFLSLPKRTPLGWYYPSLLFWLGWPGGCGAFACRTWGSSCQTGSA